MKFQTTRRAALLATTALLWLGGAAHAQSPAALEKVTVAGWSKPITEITHLLVEPDKGIFKANGIDLAYVPGAGGGDAIRNILTGQADVAFTDPGSFFSALDKMTCGYARPPMDTSRRRGATRVPGSNTGTTPIGGVGGPKPNSRECLGSERCFPASALALLQILGDAGSHAMLYLRRLSDSSMSPRSGSATRNTRARTGRMV